MPEAAKSSEISSVVLLLVLLIVIFYHSVKRHFGKKNWIKATGQVLGNVTMGDSTTVRIVFQSADGREHVFDSNPFSHVYGTPAKDRTPYKQGDRVEIIYNPEKPLDAELVHQGNPMSFYLPHICLVAIFVLLGVLFNLLT